MKKTLLPLTLTLVSAFYFGCRKDGQTKSQNADAALIHLAMQFFNDSVGSIHPHSQNPRIACLKTPLWASAYSTSSSVGRIVVVPIKYSATLQVRTNFSGDKLLDLGEITHLILYRDKYNRFHAQLVTAFPDSIGVISSQPAFTGILFVEDWVGDRLGQFKFNSNGSILSSRLNTASNKITESLSESTCYQINGYNYSADDPSDTYDWSESAGCSFSYYPDLANTAGDGPSGSDYSNIIGGSTSILVVSGTNPIGNIQDYNKCFTNVGGSDHQYSVMVCVDQPTPGTREAWGFSSGLNGTSARGNPVDVGHTFLVFTESYGGTTITRNIGFYPAGSVDPLYPSDQGQLDNNSSSIYNISLTINLTNAQFFEMLNFVAQGNNPGYLYNLNSNNCTTFALNTLAAGGVDLHTTMGSWPGGSGDDPGDFGEDIRSMQLAPNMTRNTVQNPHPNLGTCY